MKLATTLLVCMAAVVVCSGTPAPLFSDLLKATGDVQKATDSTGSFLSTTDVASQISQALPDSKYYSIKHVMDMCGCCLFSYCDMNVFNSAAKRQCEKKKAHCCDQMSHYSLLDFLSYHLSQLWMTVAPGMALNSGIAQVNSAAGGAFNMG